MVKGEAALTAKQVYTAGVNYWSKGGEGAVGTTMYVGDDRRWLFDGIVCSSSRIGEFLGGS